MAHDHVRTETPSHKTVWTLVEYEGEASPEQIKAGEAVELNRVDGEGNILLTAGITDMWDALIGNAITVFSNANAHIAVGDGTAAAAAGQTDHQGASKLRKAMDATYPSVSGDTVTFRATFGTAEANFAWEEWGVANASSAGTMLNRKVVNLGTKTSAVTRQFTVTIQLT